MSFKDNIRLFVLLISGFIAACGNSNNTGPATTIVTGSIFAGPVSGASVTVKSANGTTVAGPVTTGGDETYSINIKDTDLSSDLVFESTGGTFVDEATASSTAAGTLSAYISGGTLSTGGAVHVTPYTTIVQKLVESGKTKTEAETVFNTAFGFTPDSTLAPTDATNPATDATDAQKLAGLRVAVFSQLAYDLGESQAHLLLHLPEDLADDGVLNGLPGHLPEDIGNKFAIAFTNFLANPNNQCDLTRDEIGTLPFSKVALTTSYKVEYIPGMMNAMEGNTTFKLKITNLSDDSVAPGLSVSLMPMMYMASHEHSSPVDSVVDNGDGTYSCTIHYLMASTMNGTSMGYWELKVMIGGMMGETAYFYPSVMMSMSGDTAKATLKGQNDKITSMSMTSNRSYYCFNEGAIYGMSGSTFKLFVATMESMMSFPAVYTGVSLTDENVASWTVNSMSVEASIDNSTWVTATETGNGYWTVNGLTGLASGTAGTVYVRVIVNGEQKTTDGNAVSGSNAYAAFTVTPGTM